MKRNQEMNHQASSGVPLRESNSEDETNLDNSSSSFECNIPNDLGSLDNPVDGPRQKLYHFKRRTTCIFMTISMLISLVSLFMAVFAIAKYSDATNELKLARQSRGQLCLPCNDQLIQLQTWKLRNDRGECCVKLEEIIYLINEVTKARVKEAVQEEMNKNAADHSSFSAVVNRTSTARHSAHFLLDSDLTSDANPRILPWSNPYQNSTVTHLSSSIKYFLSTKKALITEPGYYYIYCQITIFIPVVSAAHQSTVSYSIMKESQGQEVLAQRDDMVMKTLHAKQYSQQVMYLGGAFMLHTGDRVYVVQNFGYQVHNNNHDTYFGLYRL